jgi:hypothetical protein
MLEPQTKQIDDVNVTVTQLPAMRALKLLHRILKAVAPSAAKAMASGDAKKLALTNLSEAAELLFDRLSEEDLAAVTKQLLSTAFVTAGDEQRPAVSGDILHGAFDGHIGLLMKVLAFALEVNYGDFLGVLKRAVKNLPTMKVSPSTPVSESPKPGLVAVS